MFIFASGCNRITKKNWFRTGRMDIHASTIFCQDLISLALQTLQTYVNEKADKPSVKSAFISRNMTRIQLRILQA